MEEDISDWMDRRSVLELTGSAFGLVAAGGIASATPGRDPGPKDDELLVGVSAGAGDPADVVAEHVPAGASVVHENETLRYVAVEFPDGDVGGFVDAAEADQRIKYVEPNGTMETLYTPNDPLYSDQYAPRQVNADDAWDTTLGSSSVTIAIVDTGIQYDHPDLDDNMSDIEPNHGRDFVDSDGDPYPDDLANEFHGTYVAGVVAAETDNGEGIAGISESDILACRALDEHGTGSYSDIADSIEYATDMGADVINMSFGGSTHSATLENAVQYAYHNDVYMTAAAGNDGPCTDCVAYPAAYDECAAISALDEDEDLASCSSTGPEIELAAPGENVLSTTTTERGGYERGSCSSAAAPVVAGVAGLAIDRWNVSNLDVRQHLNETAVDVGLDSNEQGNGRVDAHRAVEIDPGSSCGDTSTTTDIHDSLGSLDSDCWQYDWNHDFPCQLVVELSGPADADFDLYLNVGVGTCPTILDHTHSSDSTDSQEKIVVEDPDASTPLYVLVDSDLGSGEYDLEITEKAW